MEMRKMKQKNTLLLLLIFACLFTLTACKSVNSNNREETSTGLPSDYIEQPQVMYNNTIYFYYATGRDEVLPDGYSLVGTIEEINSKKSPDKNFYAAGVDLYTGQEIYVNPDSPDIIYLKYDTGFRKFMTESYATANPDEMNQH